MPDYDIRAELAPRDIVSRSIDHELKNLEILAFFWTVHILI